ncbi:glycerol-3-phosphate 1-O-acyltransferase PlsY [Kordiimonas aquimaris]|uniref:glycerol-3-phosphate 1-O-acyltransferase PlsY n=1 Tax=Kordiimonas aquimaris TaxID=707591 RepID=UPI0021CF8348|nr:glycerol-3-phosphate 1-O-acyltransferase PlsY [Kordiimonas aquimaris]
MSLSLETLLVLFSSYLLGSVPFGLVITRLSGLGDIRSIGSGNIGATNVLRTGRKDLALATLLLDAGKGAIAVFATLYVVNQPELAAAAGMAAFIGHCFSLYLKFAGGKGVATFFGTLFAISWPMGLAAGGSWVLSALLFRMSSLAGLITALSAPVFSYYFTGGSTWIFIAGMSIVIFVRHSDNIKRILSGTESKIGQKKSDTPSENSDKTE